MRNIYMLSILFIFVSISNLWCAPHSCKDHKCEKLHFDTKSKNRTVPMVVKLNETSVIVGEITYPKESLEKYPVALIIPDFGPYIRNGQSMFGDHIKWLPRLKTYLTTNGVAVATFDKRGTGASSYILNLPLGKRGRDVFKVYKNLKELPTIDSKSIILISIGTGIFSSLKIQKLDNSTWRSIYINPPLPDFKSFFINKGESGKKTLAIIELIEKKSKENLKPFITDRSSGKLIWMTSNPLETKGMINKKIEKTLLSSKTDQLLILDKSINKEKYLKNKNLKIFVNEKNDPEKFLRAILKFLERQSKSE